MLRRAASSRPADFVALCHAALISRNAASRPTRVLAGPASPVPRIWPCGSTRRARVCVPPASIPRKKAMPKMVGSALRCGNGPFRSDASLHRGNRTSRSPLHRSRPARIDRRRCLAHRLATRSRPHPVRVHCTPRGGYRCCGCSTTRHGRSLDLCGRRHFGPPRGSGWRGVVAHLQLADGSAWIRTRRRTRGHGGQRRGRRRRHDGRSSRDGCTGARRRRCRDWRCRQWLDTLHG